MPLSFSWRDFLSSRKNTLIRIIASVLNSKTSCSLTMSIHRFSSMVRLTSGKMLRRSFLRSDIAYFSQFHIERRSDFGDDSFFRGKNSILPDLCRKCSKIIPIFPNSSKNSFIVAENNETLQRGLEHARVEIDLLRSFLMTENKISFH